jgi:hypothetical protein
MLVDAYLLTDAIACNQTLNALCRDGIAYQFAALPCAAVAAVAARRRYGRVGRRGIAGDRNRCDCIGFRERMCMIRCILADGRARTANGERHSRTDRS